MQAHGKLICSNQMEKNRDGWFSQYIWLLLLFTSGWQNETVEGQLSKPYSIKFWILVAAFQEPSLGSSVSDAQLHSAD